MKLKLAYPCPRCHRMLRTPAFLLGGNVKIGGTVSLTCSCKKGKVVIRPEPKREEAARG